MAGRGPPPKPDALRQRRNKVIATAQLPTAEASKANRVPPLPSRGKDKDGKPVRWHPMVRRWWQSVWRSPMASQYVHADMMGVLYLLADLYQLRWELRFTAALEGISREIRLQEVRVGLSPRDRYSLRWSLDQGEAAAERTEARQARKAPKQPAKDPRSVLKAI